MSAALQVSSCYLGPCAHRPGHRGTGYKDDLETGSPLSRGIYNPESTLKIAKASSAQRAAGGLHVSLKVPAPQILVPPRGWGLNQGWRHTPAILHPWEAEVGRR